MPSGKIHIPHANGSVARDLAVAVCIAMLLPSFALLLRLLGFRHTLALLKRFNRGRRRFEKPGPATGLADTMRLAQLAQAVARRMRGWRPSCLHQSLVIWWLLDRRGVAAELRFGVRGRGPAFEAHAWVEYQGRVVNDAVGVQNTYKPLSAAIA